MSKLASMTGSGWKGYTGGVGLMLFGVCLGIEAIGVDFTDLINDATFDQAIQHVLEGLAVFGLRHRLG